VLRKLAIAVQEDYKVGYWVAAIACNRGAEGTRGFLKRLKSLEVSTFSKSLLRLRRPDSRAFGATPDDFAVLLPLPFKSLDSGAIST